MFESIWGQRDKQNVKGQVGQEGSTSTVWGADWTQRGTMARLCHRPFMQGKVLNVNCWWDIHGPQNTQIKTQMFQEKNCKVEKVSNPKKRREGGDKTKLPSPVDPGELKAKRRHRKAATRGQNPLARDHVTVHRTDWLFISNCEPIAEMRRYGQMWNVDSPRSTPPPKSSTC